ncbi:MAG: EamA family transporter [Gammaproteobacteria bacterium]|nr:EamA family transporter [Gammaproteobacteria bacterium]
MTEFATPPGSRSPGVAAALGAAALFGASVPFAKLLLGAMSPWLLAGLLYFGAGLGLTLMRLVQPKAAIRLEPGEWRWLAGAIVAGGVIAPVLLMYGLSAMPASGAALLLNAETVFTALLAWFVFRENFDRRIALGMAIIVVGALVLAWPGEARFGALWPALAVLGAALGWALDNNLTRKVALADATWIAVCKGWAAGVVNLGIAALVVDHWPPAATVAAAVVLGWVCYGLSLVLFVVALRHLGTARTSAYFSVAPFVGALIALPLLGEALTPRLLSAGALMALGVWLHLTETHRHQHAHDVLEHEHEHVHDPHHQHGHDVPVGAEVRHTHRHRHAALTHQHAHFPDMHHRHGHR